MKAIILGLVVTLSGCAFPFHANHGFPDAVSALTEKCPDLQTIDGKEVSITDMLKTVVKNYGTYYECANKVEGWNEWHSKQKQIFEGVK